MKQPRFSIGIDLAAESFYASLYTGSDSAVLSKEFSNTPEGFEGLLGWLGEAKATSTVSLICMEATGVYGERLCYFLSSHGYTLVVEAPHKVKRAFHRLTKNDKVDSIQIAEYAYRFFDQLTCWQPKKQILEKIRVLLTTREQLVSQQTANKNSLQALQRKYVQSDIALNALQQANTTIKEQLSEIEKEIMRLIKSDTNYTQFYSLITAIPSIGGFLFANLLVLTDGFTQSTNPKKLAALLGIAPYEHTSGTSVRKRTKSTGRGSSKIRKLLYLAAICAKGHNDSMKQYYERKLKEGKPPKIILNNIGNKLIKVICAMVREKAHYIPNHVSINPAINNINHLT